MTIDQCLTQIVPIVEAGGENGLVRAEAQVDLLMRAAPDDPEATAILLSELQSRVARQTKASPLRADVLDMIGTRVVAVLEKGTGFDA